MKEKDENSLFNFIAPVYGLFYNRQKRSYKKVISKMKDIVDLSKNRSIIDIGCGTGALSSVLNQEGMNVTGIEPALKMLRVAMKKKENININFIECPSCEALPIEDKSFDLSIAAYVAHGLQKEDRVKLYNEMNRVSKDYVIVHDFNKKRNIFVSFIEWLEGGDYFNFIHVVESELKETFNSVKVINVTKRAAWYICEPF